MAHWKYAIAQHPMYLIIRECTTCAERTPPWGESSIHQYITRIRRNVEALRRHPHLRLGYEWSGVELEQLAEDAPDVVAELRALAEDGRVAFYNGTYAQPHLQVLSAEANYRQFEHGSRVYRELLSWQVRTYAHQEASVHDQVPQLLRAFSIRFAVVPRFATTLRWLDGGETILFDWRGPRFVEGHEFTSWEGLDGSQVPLYLQLPRGGTLDDWLATEEMAGRLRVPPLFVKVPDLIEIDEEWLDRHSEVELVLLDDALGERLRQHPTQGRASFSSNWSYVEGIGAEALSRANQKAEAEALRAEAMGALAFALLGRPAASTDGLWRTILRAQHHDVACFCAPELRDKALSWLGEAVGAAGDLADESAKAIVAKVASDGGRGQPLVIFNTTPHRCRTLVTVETDGAAVSLTGPTEAAAPIDGAAGRVRFLADFAGAGYATWWLGPGGDALEPRPIDRSLSFENVTYRAVLEPDGTFSSLVLAGTGAELLTQGLVHGNQLTATDSAGVSPRREGEGEREDWQRPKWRPRSLACERCGPAMLRHHGLGVTLDTELSLGRKVHAALTIHLYHHLPRIDLEWRFTFDQASIGTFYDDDSKLSVHWPLTVSGEVTHDIAFGVTSSRPGLPFFPASWVDVSDGTRGFAYLHQGTPKHWVNEGILTNLLAWGEDTEAIGSRLWRHNWPKAFDQRLNGTHVIRCAIYPHEGGWRDADVVGVARAYAAPARAYLADPHPGPLPAVCEVLTLSGDEVAVTALTVRGEEVVCRLYGLGTESAAVTPRSQHLVPAGLRSLADGPVEQVAPFQVAELALGRKRPE